MEASAETRAAPGTSPGRFPIGHPICSVPWSAGPPPEACVPEDPRRHPCDPLLRRSASSCSYRSWQHGRSIWLRPRKRAPEIRSSAPVLSPRAGASLLARVARAVLPARAALRAATPGAHAGARPPAAAALRPSRHPASPAQGARARSRGRSRARAHGLAHGTPARAVAEAAAVMPCVSFRRRRRAVRIARRARDSAPTPHRVVRPRTNQGTPPVGSPPHPRRSERPTTPRPHRLRRAPSRPRALRGARLMRAASTGD